MRIVIVMVLFLILMSTAGEKAYCQARNLDSILLDISKNYLQPNRLTLYSMEKKRPVDLSLLLGAYLNEARRSPNVEQARRLEQELSRYLADVAQRANPIDQTSKKRVSKELLVNYLKKSSLDESISRSIRNKYNSSSRSGNALTYSPPSAGSLFTDGYNPPSKRQPQRNPRSAPKLLQKHDAISLLGERADQKGTRTQPHKTGIQVHRIVPGPYLSADLLVGTWTSPKCSYRWTFQKRGQGYIGYSVGPGPKKKFVVNKITHSKHALYDIPDVNYDGILSMGASRSIKSNCRLNHDPRKPGKLVMWHDNLNWWR